MRETTMRNCCSCVVATKTQLWGKRQATQKQQQKQKIMMTTNSNCNWKNQKHKNRLSNARSTNDNDDDDDNDNDDNVVVHAAIKTKSRKHYNYKRISKLLIALTILLITTATICQTSAATTIAAATASSVPVTATAATLSLLSTQAAAALQQQQKQKQLQQQQLFALLKNDQLKANDGADIDAAAIDAGVGVGAGGGSNYYDEDDTSSFFSAASVAENNIRRRSDNQMFDTNGFIADIDQQQFETSETAANKQSDASKNANDASKVDLPILIATIANVCPTECRCLNDYFDCSKKHLDQVPQLPLYVKNLDFEGNKFNDSSVLGIRNLTELNKLTLKRNELRVMPIFSGLTALKQLSLAHNHIELISARALAAVPTLKMLDLSKNNIHTLDISFFPSNNQLSQLTLNANRINAVPENAFEYLGNLSELEMNSNRLTTLPSGVFKYLHKLKKLSLNYNNLEMNWSTFKGLQGLQKLYLKGNGIRALQDGIFHVMRSIQTIALDHNDISSLNRQGLFNLTKLKRLSLSNNTISRIELDTWEFTQSLVHLDLSFNNISEFKPPHLDCLHRLKYLNLAHNYLQYLAEPTFDCVKNLEELNLRRNKLAWIIEDPIAPPPFKALRKLKKLDLYGNNLKQINTKSLYGLYELQSLNLGGNALASVQQGAFEHLSRLQKFVFKSLNFICDCDLVWFRRWLQKRFESKSALQSHAICGYPEHLLDRELTTLHINDLICADSPKPVITQEPSSQLAVRGANVTMECIGNSPSAAALAATDELKIKWRHDSPNARERERNAALANAGAGVGVATHNAQHSGGIAANAAQLSHAHANVGSYSTTETQILNDDSTNQTTIFGYLRLYNVSYESAGKYQCVVSNAFGTTYSQKFKVSIGIHPAFLQTPSNMIIDAGNSARLVCSATGDPIPEIALQKFGSNDFPAAMERRLLVVQEENAFIITNAKPIDAGIYTCTAESSAGEIKINATLTVNDKPQLQAPHTQKEIVLGESSVLDCLHDMAGELNNPHREWYKDNKPFHAGSISAGEDHIYFTAENELLVIVNTQSGDAGQYRCDISDNFKTYVVHTELIVVKESFGKNIILLGLVLLVAVCVAVGSLIIWTVLYYQKRKMFAAGDRGGVENGSSGVLNVEADTGFMNFNASEVDARRIAAGSSQLVLNGSVGSGLDQTQLSMLNRTYLAAQMPPALATNQPRPRSLADLDASIDCIDTAEQRQRLLTADDAPIYRKRNGRMDNDGEGFTLEYLQHNNSNDVEQNQDYLSSKDSGTGSDAAVKRSNDDIHFTLMPVSCQTAVQQQLDDDLTPVASTPMACADTYSSDDDGNDFKETCFMGIGQCAVTDEQSMPYRQRLSYQAAIFKDNAADERTLSKLHHSDDDADDSETITNTLQENKPNQNASTNYKTAKASKAVDI